jgi:DNA-directed RNA polymerase II subunit RPB11
MSLQVTNAGTFRFNREDHTVGNLFRMQLLRDPSVRFAGYYHPHPLVYYINLKIQTNNSTVAPVEVLSSAIEDLANETDHLMTQFQDACEAWKRENDTDMGGQF